MRTLSCRIRHARVRCLLPSLLSETTRHASLQGTGAPGCRAARSCKSLDSGGGPLLPHATGNVRREIFPNSPGPSNA